MTYYVLNAAGQPERATADEWSRWMSEHNASRRIASTQIGDASVSTVFLGLDHQWGDGPPLLFETMIFEGPHDQWCERWSTREEAVAGHDRVVADLAGGREPGGGA